MYSEALIFVFAIFESFFLPITSGYELYNSKQAVCCEGKLFPLEDDEGQRVFCCGENTMAYKQLQNGSVCCNGEIQPTRTGSIYQCCDIELIDLKKFSCLNQNMKIEIPQSKMEGGHPEICGTSKDDYQFYSWSESRCCEGSLHKVDSRKQCFGSEYIDSETHIWCHKMNVFAPGPALKVLPLEGRNRQDTSCCGLQIYDLNSQFCIDDIVVNKSENVVKRCCGYTYTLNWTTQNWDVEKNDESSDDDVCNQLILLNKYACFKNVLYDISNDENTCFSASSSTFIKYNMKSQACCPSGVFNLTEEEIHDGKYHCCEMENIIVAKRKMY